MAKYSECGHVASLVFDMLISACLLLGCLVYSLLMSTIWSIVEKRQCPTGSAK